MTETFCVGRDASADKQPVDNWQEKKLTDDGNTRDTFKSNTHRKNTIRDNTRAQYKVHDKIS